MKHFLTTLVITGVLTGIAHADTYTDDFSGYATEADFRQAWYVYLHPTDTGAGDARLDTTADAVLISAKQRDGGKTFALTQLLNLQHKHRLSPTSTVRVEAEFDQTESVPWSDEPIAPNRIGLSGKGIDIWGQVGLHKQNDGTGTLVAKVAYRDSGEEVVLLKESNPGFGSYNGKPITLVITGQTVDLLVADNSVIGGPVEHNIDMNTSPLGNEDLQAFIQQQRVFAPQPRSSVLHSVSVTEE